MENVNPPRLEDQLCFPLYVIAKEIIGKYRPYLDELGITYPQYLVMMVLWDKDGLTVTKIGEKLYLDSSTLTPLLKRLEHKNYISRQRKMEDERVVEIFLTLDGTHLKQKACSIPERMQQELNLSEEELDAMKIIVNKLLLKIEK